MYSFAARLLQLSHHGCSRLCHPTTLESSARLILKVPPHQKCISYPFTKNKPQRLRFPHQSVISNTKLLARVWIIYHWLCSVLSLWPFTTYTPSRILRSFSDIRLLRIQGCKGMTCGFRSCSHFGPYLTSGILSRMVSGTAQLFHHLKQFSKPTFSLAVFFWN